MITVENLIKVYPNETKALDDISFNIERGSICGYLGTNGAGKTTTVKIITGMMKATSGNVFVDGINVNEYPQKVKKIIGYVPESSAVLQSLSPLDFLEFVCKIYDLEKNIYLSRIYEFLELFGLRNEINTPMYSFSKGMRQKVLLISSLIHNPEVIFWDEPLSGLDFNTSLLIKDLVKELSQSGKTFFYCSHILDIVEKVCNRVIILNSGRIVFDKNIDMPESADISLEKIFSEYINVDGQKDMMSKLYSKIINKQ